MGANDLKKIYENMPRGIKAALAPVFVRIMVHNPAFKEAWGRIVEFERADASKRKDLQLEALRSPLMYAYENVSFYRKRFDEPGKVELRLMTSQPPFGFGGVTFARVPCPAV